MRTCRKPHDPFADLIPPQGIKLTPRHYAYIKIAEGCNHRCTFCIIPSMRGDLVSRPIGEVMQEAENLVKAGVKELLVISQDTSAYGVDIKYRTGFWGGRPLKTRMTDLARALAELGVWVRLHYVYPYPHVDEVVPLMADGKLLPYLDVPFQHASARILKLMKRPANAEDNLARIRRWREICPELTIRSTFIVGFPGETQAEFEELLDFLEQAQLDRVGCFAYSPVEGAVANALPDPVPEEVKEERRARFMAAQEAISAARLRAKIGRTMTVLVDEVRERRRGGAQRGRCAGDRRVGLHRERQTAQVWRIRAGSRDACRHARSVGRAGLSFTLPSPGARGLPLCWRGDSLRCIIATIVLCSDVHHAAAMWGVPCSMPIEPSRPIAMNPASAPTVSRMAVSTRFTACCTGTPAAPMSQILFAARTRIISSPLPVADTAASRVA